MGLIDNIRGIFSGSKNSQTSQPQINEEYEKSILADKIVDLIGKIKRVNSFDSSIWNLSNASSFELKRKSLDELQTLKITLETRLSQLTRQSQRVNPGRESLEASKWTGQIYEDMSRRDLDRFQTGDDGR